ncbi:MAG TPA: hypothetical protein VJ894_00370 [Cryomorphaceae bacterium]|nr:hypothetical protein [Cryomorphaceae bacterium]
MQNIGRILGAYLFPVLLIAMGLLLLIVSSGQTGLFKLAGLGILIVGILGALYVKGIISKQIQLIVTIVVAIGVVVFAYMDYTVIQDELAFHREKEKVKTAVVQRLKDIRKAQLAYNKEYGKYANSFDSLIYFLKHDEISLIKRLGSLPDSLPTEEMAMEAGIIQTMPEGMTDMEVIEQGLIVRDTIQVKVLGYIFNDDDRDKRKTKFYVDSLPYVPYSDHRFQMEADIVDISGAPTPVFQVKDPQPYAEQYMLGSLVDASTSGNWTE